ncbi:MAG: glycerol-3-phosphate 1-O-acyltransferase [Nitrospiraceae bacterium]|nr:glycerol-3-phosphate 1-O-acyltransferase [Nitrospiraceae bacterium]MSR24937.1 glycerol-3-phosphate 1-O-acyltransferase [Nitrospiraceae bacterium]
MGSLQQGDWLPILLALGGYLAGSVPFGIVVSKCLGAPDPRTAGSRNIGFTNVLRVSGKKAGILTLAGDMGKGWAVGWLAVHTIDHETWILAIALCPVLGHLLPVFLRFQGGKGVATAMGAVGGIAPPVGLGLITIWLLTAALWRYSSGAALAAFCTLPILAMLAGKSGQFLVFTLVLSGIILARHSGNIARLWHGTEPKIGQSSSLHNTSYQTQ